MPVEKQSADPVKKAQLQKVRLYKPGSEEFEDFSPASARDMRRIGWSEQPNSGPVADVRKSEQAAKTVDGVTYYPVWSPTGVKEYHTAVNKRDLLANAGWKEIPPKKIESVLAPEAVPGPVEPEQPVEPPPVMENVVVPGPDGPITVPDPTSVKTGMTAEDVLDDLMKRAADVGLVRIDRRWSVATLLEKVQEAEAAKSATENIVAPEATNPVTNEPAPPVPTPPANPQ